ncbi:DMT family transporter [candidate division KSB1 bacterium]
MKIIRSIQLVDSLLFIVVLIWASNFTVVKFALREIPPMGFNTLRFIGSSVIFALYYHFYIRDYSFVKTYFVQLVLLALIGNTLMQITFIHGMNSTTAGNASLMYSTVPLFIALLSVGLKYEKVKNITWLGIAISFFGIVLIVSSGKDGFSLSHSTIRGDVLMLVTSFCWSAYTVLARPLIQKSSMMKVLSLTFIFGTIMLIPFGIPDFLRMDWSGISLKSWQELVYSFLFANVIAYIIWFYAVSKIGNVQTAILQNLIPVLAVIIAAVFLKETITLTQLIGGIGIIGGVTITRLTMFLNSNTKNGEKQ